MPDKLFHDEKVFERESFHERMERYGFKNMGRMELFLWDLEIFLQIQSILGDRVVLKGGAATQFYLPMEAQRTSVDIDILFSGAEEEIEYTLSLIEKELGGTGRLFEFKKYVPQNPKTSLPLYTYYVEVPSVLTSEERRALAEDIPCQELKVEFILHSDKQHYQLCTGENIFAVCSSYKYQILSLNELFADKLTALGCETIGVQNKRMDEQVKHFYDIMMLTKYCLDEMDPKIVYENYLKRANEEWVDRIGDNFNFEAIVSDVETQLLRYAMADSGEDSELKKYINDFRSLYLNEKVDFSPQSVACGAALIGLVYKMMLSDQDWKSVRQALKVEERLQLEDFSGREKGLMSNKIRDILITAFGSRSEISQQVLKGKNVRRVFWAVVNVDNIDEIEQTITDALN